MKKISISNTDLKVSQMSLGCLYFGARDSKEKSYKRLDQYIAAGGNFLDTANIYAHWINENTKGGESELLIGEWLKEKKNRHDVVIATKVGFAYGDVPYGSSAKLIRQECEKSLKRLDVDYIDLYYMHSDDRSTPMEESLCALNDLCKEGKIRAIGASNFKAWRLERAKQISKQNGFLSYCCIQQRYSYLRPKAGWDFGDQVSTNDDLLEYVQDADIQLLAYSPLLSGAYSDPNKSFMEQYKGLDSDARLKALGEVANELGATNNQLVYAWLVQNTPMSIPLVASSTDAQFKEAVGAFDINLTQEQLDKLNNARF